MIGQQLSLLPNLIVTVSVTKYETTKHTKRSNYNEYENISAYQ